MSVEWDVNYVAVVVAAVAGMVIGAVYFMPAVAGKAWMKAVGKSQEDLTGANQPILYVMAGVFTLLMATVLAAAIGWADANTLGGGALVGLILWIGFSVPVIGLTFAFELRPMANHVITGLDYLITLVVMGAIIGAWPTG